MNQRDMGAMYQELKSFIDELDKDLSEARTIEEKEEILKMGAEIEEKLYDLWEAMESKRSFWRKVHGY